MSFKQHKNLPYFNVAGQAVQLEREGCYRIASPAWMLAGRLSHSKANQQWSEDRAAFCLRQAAIQEEHEEAIREELNEAIPDDVPA